MNQPFEMKQTAPWSRMLRLTAILALTVASTAHARLSVFEALDSASGHPTRFAWVFRTNVTGDFGIVTEDFGPS